MLSVFENMALAALKNCGELGTYNPSGEDPISAYLILEKRTEPQPDGHDAVVMASYATIEGSLSVFGKKPVNGETFTLNSTTWTVGEVVYCDDLTVRVTVTE